MSNRSNGFSSPSQRPDVSLRRLGLMAMALAGAWFGFANPFLHFPAAIVLLPAALSLTARDAASPRHAFRLGMLTALPAYAASLYWLAIPVHDYGGLPWAVALPCPVLVGAVLAAYAGLYCLGLHAAMAHGRGVVGVILAGLLWASLELARDLLLTGFPWLTLSTALAPWPATIGLAAWIGAFGLSGVVVAAAHALVQPTWSARCLALPLVVLILLPASMRPAPQPAATATVAMIQGNIDQGQKWDEAMQASIVSTYTGLTRQALRDLKPDLVVWPETAMPFYFQDSSVLSDTVRDCVAETGVPLLAGAPAYTMLHEPGEAPYVLHNRAYLIGERGAIKATYDKEHLVPFGEYVPLGKWLPFIAKLVPGEYEFRPGRNETPLQSGSMAMGVLICYEAIFPELAQQHVANGANVLMNISNDAWFGRSSAPWQHLHLAVLRAVEQNRAIVRGTNTGISTIIAPDGSMRDFPPMFAPAIIPAPNVELLTATTFYHDHFTLIHTAFPVLGLSLLLLMRRETRTTPIR